MEVFYIYTIGWIILIGFSAEAANTRQRIPSKARKTKSAKSLATQEPSENDLPTQSADNEDLENPVVEKNSWYIRYAIGYLMPFYDPSLKPLVDRVSNSSSLRIPLSSDLGVYFPIFVPNLLLGASLNGGTDGYISGSYSVSFWQAALNASMIYSFGSEPAGGLYLRGDLGVSRFSVFLSDGETYDLNTWGSKWGFGARAGLGFGFKVWEKHKMTISGSYDYRNYSGAGAPKGMVAIDVGFLFGVH